MWQNLAEDLEEEFAQTGLGYVLPGIRIFKKAVLPERRCACGARFWPRQESHVTCSACAHATPAPRAVQCLVCSRVVDSIRDNQRFCSDACRVQSRRKPRPKPKPCATCGALFESRSQSRRYCDNPCKVKAMIAKRERAEADLVVIMAQQQAAGNPMIDPLVAAYKKARREVFRAARRERLWRNSAHNG